MRSIPASVFGPVLSPPWSLHRPFGIAGHWHRVARRVFASHRGAFEKSPDGLAFLSAPRRFSWGVSLIFRSILLPLFPCGHCPNNGLPASMHVDMLHGYSLSPRPALQSLHGVQLLDIKRKEFTRSLGVVVPLLRRSFG